MQEITQTETELKQVYICIFFLQVMAAVTYLLLVFKYVRDFFVSMEMKCSLTETLGVCFDDPGPCCRGTALMISKNLQCVSLSFSKQKRYTAPHR